MMQVFPLLMLCFVAYCGPGERTRSAYAQHCAACHETGASGAPTRQARYDWQIRRNQNPQDLLASVRRGLVAMPPSGRCVTCSDEELIDIINYMRD